MGKDNGKAPAKKAADKGAEKKIGRNAQDEGFKFGASDLADRMGVSAVVLRQKLRKANIKKNGSVYGWNTKAEMDEVQAKLEGPAKKSAKKDAKSEKKPAAKPAGKAKPKGDEQPAA